MADYITLLGAESVQNAARQMSNAAEQMSHAASSIDHTMEQQRRFLDDWLMRFTDALEKLETKT